MKLLLALSLVLTASLCAAQNTPPTVEITSTSVDELAQNVTIFYTLDDADNDLCEVWIKISTDSGEYYETVTSNAVSGDVGDDIASAEGLALTWNYSGFAGFIGDVHVKVYASDHSVVNIQEMVDQVDEDQLLSYLEQVVGERHYQAAPEHLENARQVMSAAFSTAGLQTEGHDFQHLQTDMQNIIGRKPGARNEAITYIIDGHFDGVEGSPGADDNGSAVAGVLEALRILSQYEFEHSLRFIGFDAEELGLIGSLRYVQNGIKPYEEIAGVLNLEMIGYYDDAPNTQLLPEGFDLLFPAAAQDVADDEFRGNFLTVVGNVASNPLISAFLNASETYVPDLRLIDVAVPGNGTIAPDLRRSDHSRFWDANYQALMLTDGSEFRNFNYHTPNDVIETLNFTFMAQVVAATLATAAELAIPISAGSATVDLAPFVQVSEHKHALPGQLRIFPNPTNGILSLISANNTHAYRARCEVYDLSGQLVHRELCMFTAGTSGARIDVQHLAAGSYILVVHSGDAAQSLGFSVQR
jgi:Mor family transcriptional regulator